MNLQRRRNGDEAMIFVCPMPYKWNHIYELLREAADTAGLIDDPPPTPLILAGWTFSTDSDKQRRWHETVEWASVHRFQTLILPLREADQYRVVELGGGCVIGLGDQYEQAKVRPREVDTLAALDYLSANWQSIVGVEFSRMTRPLRFTGRKRRRLIVVADSHYTPPWGSWHALPSSSGNRSEFTRLRCSINQAIAPLEVDHIDFRIR
jgi:hypothetical protein